MISKLVDYASRKFVPVARDELRRATRQQDERSEQERLDDLRFRLATRAALRGVLTSLPLGPLSVPLAWLDTVGVFQACATLTAARLHAKDSSFFERADWRAEVLRHMARELRNDHKLAYATVGLRLGGPFLRRLLIKSLLKNVPWGGAVVVGLWNFAEVELYDHYRGDSLHLRDAPTA